jgi:hypothetical protein
LQTVDELIDPGTGMWNVQLVEQTFCRADADLILALPVHVEMDNCVAWRYDKRGLFSVKSAYKHKNLEERRSIEQQGRGFKQGAVETNIGFEVSRQDSPFHMEDGTQHSCNKNGAETEGMELETKCVMCDWLDEDGTHLFFQM